MAGYVTNPATKFEDNTTFLSWVTSYNVSIGYHWKYVRGHCACAESRDSWIGGQKQLHFWNPRPRFAYSLCNFYWAPTTIKGRLLSSCPMLKPFSGEKFVLPKRGQNCGFGGKWGCKSHILTRRSTEICAWLTAVDFVGRVSTLVAAITSVVCWYTQTSRVTLELIGDATTRCIQSQCNTQTALQRAPLNVTASIY